MLLRIPGRLSVIPGRLSVGRAADILWLHSGPWAYRSFVSDRGWGQDGYQAWIGDTLYHQLMDRDAA